MGMMSISTIIESTTPLPMELSEIIQDYAEEANKIQRTVWLYHFFFDETPAFKQALSNEDIFGAIQALQKGASYIMSSREILNLTNKPKSLDLLIAQVSLKKRIFTYNEWSANDHRGFIRQQSAIRGACYYRRAFITDYEDQAARNIRDAFFSIPPVSMDALTWLRVLNSREIELSKAAERRSEPEHVALLFNG